MKLTEIVFIIAMISNGAGDDRCMNREARR